MQGKGIVAVTSGANMNFDRLRLVTELADLGANVRHMTCFHSCMHAHQRCVCCLCSHCLYVQNSRLKWPEGHARPALRVLESRDSRGADWSYIDVRASEQMLVNLA